MSGMMPIPLSTRVTLETTTSVMVCDVGGEEDEEEENSDLLISSKSRNS